MLVKTEKEILDWYKTASTMEKLIFYRSAQAMLNEYETLKRATERLSVETARYIAEHGVDNSVERKALLIYADIREEGMSTNAIQAIMPYRQFGTWVFDDPDAGLVREPFVLGIPEMIDVMVDDIPNAKDGFRLNSGLTKPAKSEGVHHIKLTALEKGGAWYRDVETRMCGWLCPATLLYFQVFPEEMYIWGDEMVTSAQIATHNMNQTRIEEMKLEPTSFFIIDDPIISTEEDWVRYLNEHGIPNMEDKR